MCDVFYHVSLNCILYVFSAYALTKTRVASVLKNSFDKNNLAIYSGVPNKRGALIITV